MDQRKSKDQKDNEEGGEIPIKALTEDQIEEIREVLAKYKTETVGKISQLDACEAMYDLGLYRTEAEVSQMFEEFMLDTNEEISEEEFLHVMTKAYQHLYDRESLKATFHVLDWENSQFILPAQLRTFARDMGAHYTDAEFEDMFREADYDNDGKISWSDFIRAAMP